MSKDFQRKDIPTIPKTPPPPAKGEVQANVPRGSNTPPPPPKKGNN